VDGDALASRFLDGPATDVERLQRVKRTPALLPVDGAAFSGWRGARAR